MMFSPAILSGQTEKHLVEFHGHLVYWGIVSDLQALCIAAKHAGFELAIASSFRGFDRQMFIWQNKYCGEKLVYDIDDREVKLDSLTDLEKCQAIMLFSALPGASRHHWGTDLDFYDKAAITQKYQIRLQQDEYQNEGLFSPLNTWLDNNLEKYGFFKPYDEYRGGVAPEPWHISHRATADIMLKKLSLNMLHKVIYKCDISPKQVILDHLPQLYQRFVLNINPH